MKKVWKKVLAFGLCGVLIFSVMPPLPVMAKNVQRNIATNSNAEKNENTPVATKSNADTANKATLMLYELQILWGIFGTTGAEKRALNF